MKRTERKLLAGCARVMFAALLLTAAGAATAAPVFNAPAVRIQPNGDTLHCLLSGDEYYHRLHDAAGFTIVQHPETGYWVYADTVHIVGDDAENGKGVRWQVVATDLVAGVADPARAGLSPNVGIDRTDWEKRQHRFDVPKELQPKSAAKTSGRNHGTLNNIVIFVRFSDESEISTPLSTIDAMFNDSSANATSMYNYFKTVSYNKIHIPTHYYPTPNGNNVVSFQDSLPRAYYMPYDATTNPDGYSSDSERRNREFSLLQRAVNYVNANCPIPMSLNLDMDNDNYVDNICFVVKGTYTGWSDLLWPHKWSLYDRQVYINGKRVYTFNLQLEGSGDHYFSSSTFCHEMFHTLGAPDLYRYEVGTNVSGVGSWDLMCSNTTPPQTMSAYMKWKYGNWIDSIPEITTQGTYTLHSLGDNDYSNIAYKIAAQEPNQWYVLEYRDNTEQFETTLPGKGLIIFRIDDRFDGNANYDGITEFDEVYLFRPNAPNDSTNGNPAQAFFSQTAGRTAFSQTSNPRPWLTGNVIDTTIAITAIGVPGETISFTYNDLRGCVQPANLSATEITGISALLRWSGNSSNYKLQWRPVSSDNITTVDVSGRNYYLSGLSVDSEYEWRVRGECSSTDITPYSDWQHLHTALCIAPSESAIGIGETTSYSIPVNTYYNYTYSQMLYTPVEVGQAMNINKIAFNYSSATPLDSKGDCIIYMGNTSKTTFTGTGISDLVPFSNLSKVYEGPLNCVQGWNEFYLDSIFAYDGTSNLVVAIDDNSGDYNGSSYKFYCSNSTSSSLYTTLTYYSDNTNYDPAGTSTSTGSKTRFHFHPDIVFEGCTQEAPNVYTVTVASSSDEQGSVSGEGIFIEGETATISATANEHYHFSHWHSEVSGRDIDTNPYTFTVNGDSTFTAVFAINQHRIVVTVDPASAQYGQAWFTAEGIDGQAFDEMLDYGSVVTLYAEAYEGVVGEEYLFDRWNDGNSFTPRTVTLTQDTAFTATFLMRVVSIDGADREEVYVYVSDGKVTIAGAAGRSIEIFDIAGRCIHRKRGTGNDIFALPSQGVYVVRIDQIATQKIVNK